MQDTPICRTNSDGFFSLVSQNIHFLSSKKNRQVALMQDSDVQILYKKLKQRRLNKNTCFLIIELQNCDSDKLLIFKHSF